MITTLKAIKNNCGCDWERYELRKLLGSLGKSGIEDMDYNISLKMILELTGIEVAANLGLIGLDYKDYCLFVADVAESVLDIFESEYPDNDKPRKLIEAIRLYERGEITKGSLFEAAEPVRVYADGITDYYHDAAAAVYYAVVKGFIVADFAIDAVYAQACDFGDPTVRVDAKWQEIEELFVKHFCNEEL